MKLYKDNKDIIEPISMFETSGRTSIGQMINTTNNEMFVFQDNTSQIAINTIYIFPKYNLGIFNKKENAKFRFDWEGGLSDIKDKIDSVELQHKALAWRK